MLCKPCVDCLALLVEFKRELGVWGCGVMWMRGLVASWYVWWWLCTRADGVRCALEAIVFVSACEDCPSERKIAIACLVRVIGTLVVFAVGIQSWGNECKDKQMWLPRVS